MSTVIACSAGPPSQKVIHQKERADGSLRYIPAREQHLGRCTSFAVEVTEAHLEGWLGVFEFEFYDPCGEKGRHRVARCKRTGICICSASNQGRRDILSKDLKVLYRAIDAVESSSNMSCYMRRIALARLAEMYDQACAIGGRMVVTKSQKAAAIHSIVEAECVTVES